jgi:hypothetical protein
LNLEDIMVIKREAAAARCIQELRAGETVIEPGQWCTVVPIDPVML